MASATYGPTAQADQVRGAVAEVKSLTVDRLKRILRNENLQVSGLKSELQLRLIAHIERCATVGDYAHIDRIRQTLRGVTNFSMNPYPSPYSQHTPTSSQSPQFNSPTPRQLAPPPPPLTPFAMPSYTPNRLTFKKSPFYTITKPVSQVHELKAREQTRDTKKVELQLDYSAIDQLQRDKNVRVMVFCAAESHSKISEPVDISFPQHGELKCNTADVKHNLKGMKNKPGTTRPADITDHIRKSATYPNSVELVYALTTKIDHAEQALQSQQKYYLIVNMVQKRPIDTLVTELKTRRTPFQKDRVTAEMKSKAEDPDIVATSSVMSLKDPLQMTRIQVPCRGVSCTHNACFDAFAYLALQEQAPTWSCPHCNKPASWENLAFDHYFDDILRSTPSSIDQVTIEPDGRWHKDVDTAAQNNEDRGNTTDDDDDDDIVEITDTRVNGSSTRDSSFVRTPSLPAFNGTPTAVSSTSLSRTPATAPPSATPASRSNKRPHSETIDLTLDSDEDEPPVSRVKRPSFNYSTSDLYRTQTQRSPSLTSHNPSTQPMEPYRFNMPPPNHNPYGTNRYNPNF